MRVPFAGLVVAAPDPALVRPCGAAVPDRFASNQDPRCIVPGMTTRRCRHKRCCAGYVSTAARRFAACYGIKGLKPRMHSSDM